MINPRDIEAKVKAQLQALRIPITEDLLHEAYRAFMFEALEEARMGLHQLEGEIDAYRASHPDQGWTMMTKAQRDQLHAHVKGLKRMVYP